MILVAWRRLAALMIAETLRTASVHVEPWESTMMRHTGCEAIGRVLSALSLSAPFTTQVIDAGCVMAPVEAFGRDPFEP